MKKIKELLNKFIHDYGDCDAIFNEELFTLLKLVHKKGFDSGIFWGVGTSDKNSNDTWNDLKKEIE